MTELFDEITRVVETANEAYMAGYRDAKLELRRRLGAVTVAEGPAALAEAYVRAYKMLAVVTEFIDV